MATGAKEMYRRLDGLRTQLRGHCWRCKAHKFIKYLKRVAGARGGVAERWECINLEKCHRRAANYRS